MFCQRRITFRKGSGPSWKNILPLFTHSPPKNSKSASPPFLPTLKIFQPLHCRKGGRTLSDIVGHIWLSKISLINISIVDVWTFKAWQWNESTMKVIYWSTDHYFYFTVLTSLWCHFEVLTPFWKLKFNFFNSSQLNEKFKQNWSWCFFYCISTH